MNIGTLFKKTLPVMVLLIFILSTMLPPTVGQEINAISLNTVETSGKTLIMIETNHGDILLELYQDLAPITVQNFIDLIAVDFFDGLVFHRVIDDFVIQGGGYDVNGSHRKSPFDSIPLEIHPEARHIDGAIGMARTSDPNSATSQFYICDGPQEFLDDNYAVFGEVIDGIEVVRDIASVPTERKHRMDDWPIDEVIISQIEYVSGTTWYVDDDNTEGPWDGTEAHPFQYIQDAIDQADQYNTIIVRPGTYDGSLHMQRSVQLIGTSKEDTIIQMNTAEMGILMEHAQFSSLQQFSIDCSVEELTDIITLTDVDHTLIQDIAIKSEPLHHYGISVSGSYNILQNVTITGNHFTGIQLIQGNGNSIHHCTIESSTVGILVSRSHENTITSNRIVHSAKALTIEEANQNQISDNTFKDNEYGIFSSYSTKNQIEQNNFMGNDQHAKFTKFCQIGFLAPNKWRQNYWEGLTGSIKIIPGLMYVPYGIPLTLFIPWIEFDFSPSTETHQ